MTSPKPSTIDWNHLTDNHAAILEAYFALYQQRDPATIGSGEILRWFREQRRPAPSEALIRTVLAAVAATVQPHKRHSKSAPQSDGAPAPSTFF
jgi:hypothetical protein